MYPNMYTLCRKNGMVLKLSLYLVYEGTKKQTKYSKEVENKFQWKCTESIECANDLPFVQTDQMQLVCRFEDNDFEQLFEWSTRRIVGHY